MKKGFTLIELLGVIILLAVIALIATPIILNVVEESEKKAFLVDCESIEKAAELYVIDSKNGVVPDGTTIKISDFKDYLSNVKNVDENEYVLVNKIDGELSFYYTGREKNPHEGYESLKDKIASNNSMRETTINGVSVNKVIGNKTNKETSMHNYVWFSGQLWQAVDINNNNHSIKLVTANSLTQIGYQGNITNRSNYANSWVKEWLENEFYKVLKRKDLIVKTDFCLDMITENFSSHTKKTNCTNNQKYNVGLLTYEDFVYAKDGVNASVDSFLNEDEYSYLMTPYSSSSVWLTHYSESLLSYENNSNISGTKPEYGYGKSVRAVISINDSVLVKSGSGTKADPYVLSSEPKLNTNNNLASAKVGDYVYMDESNNPYNFSQERISSSVVYNTNKSQVRYRIIEILSDGRVKLQRASVLINVAGNTEVKNDENKSNIKFYSDFSCYSDETCNTTNASGKNIFNPNQGSGEFKENQSDGDSLAFFLNNATNSFYNWYSSTAKNMISKNKWELFAIGTTSGYINKHNNLNITPNGSYPSKTYDGIVEAYVGLMSWGEMYSGNDLDIAYWQINRLTNELNVAVSHQDGLSKFGGLAGSWYATRPVIVLKNGVYVTSGSGTMTDPYSLGI